MILLMGNPDRFMCLGAQLLELQKLYDTVGRNVGQSTTF